VSAEHGTGHIIQSLIVNTIIATAKLIAAVFTKSGSMLAEGIHSAADCGNQLLLLWGVKQGQQVADAKHPLGYGRNVYFW
jgi:divalent metal cation (Fe/Co/Zn/Cd) transporter